MESSLLGTALEMLVLEVIAGGPSYGYEIAQTVAGRSGENARRTARPRSSDCENPAPVSACAMFQILERCIDIWTPPFNTLLLDLSFLPGRNGDDGLPIATARAAVPSAGLGDREIEHLVTGLARRIPVGIGGILRVLQARAKRS